MKLERPFLVMATQNPLEQEGTYPLPEAQLDRFMFNTFVDYPTDAEMVEIVEKTTGNAVAEVDTITDAQQIIAVQRIIRDIPIARPVVDYIVRLAVATRPAHPSAPAFIKDYVSWGCGPRAGQYLALGAKARAALNGQPHASIEDVRAVALSVLRHRIALNYNGRAEGYDTIKVVNRLLESVPADGKKG